MKASFFFKIYKRIRDELPEYVFGSIIKLTPIYLASSLFEIIGLVVLFPVIKLIIAPQYIQENKYFLYVYNLLEFNSTISFVIFLFTSITIIFIVKNILVLYISKIQTDVSFKMASRIASEKYNSYLNRDYSFFTERNSAVLLRNIAQIPFELIANIVIPFSTIINELIVLTLIIILLAVYDPILYLSLILFTVPFLFIYNRVHKKKLKEVSDKKSKESEEMFKLGLQSIEMYREILVFNKKNYFKPIFRQTLDNYTKAISDVYLINLVSPKIVETIAIVSIFSIFITGYILHRDLTALAQFLIVFAIAAYRVIPSVNKLILYTNYIKSSVYIFDTFNKEEWQLTNVETRPKEHQQKFTFEDKLEIKNLHFRYSKLENDILSSLNLTVKKGETIGIVGPSGSGKTTLLNILLRLFEEQEGGIYVDNRKVDKGNLHEWYDLISYVPQNIQLLDGTIAENIAFGLHPDEIEKEKLEKVINQAQLREFVNRMPEREGTKIGEHGIKISGGQRQRIGIARALYHGGCILIFDEATSALDTETEKMLTDSIHDIQGKDLTIIIVAHRIQTLKYCDRIYELASNKLHLTTVKAEK